MTLTKTLPFMLSVLPYDQSALAPVISAETLSYHYNRHHQGYVDKLNDLVEGTEYEEFELEKIIIKTAGRSELAALFNNASQIWNHSFYWNSLSPKGGGRPTGALAEKINASFKHYDDLQEKWIEVGTAHFGSGWVWLVEEKNEIKIIQTTNADNPISLKQGKPLLVLDLWEHAYYLDYQNRRRDHLKSVIGHLINWRFAEENSMSGDRVS